MIESLTCSLRVGRVGGHFLIRVLLAEQLTDKTAPQLITLYTTTQTRASHHHNMKSSKKGGIFRL